MTRAYLIALRGGNAVLMGVGTSVEPVPPGFPRPSVPPRPAPSGNAYLLNVKTAWRDSLKSISFS